MKYLGYHYQESRMKKSLNLEFFHPKNYFKL